MSKRGNGDRSDPSRSFSACSQLGAGSIRQVSDPGAGCSPRVVIAACVAVLALGATVELVTEPHQADRVSYRAGYAGASDGRHVRMVMTRPGVASAALCDTLVERALAVDDSRALVRADFVSGCQQAVADAME